MELNIVYEDNYIIAVEKPSGIPSQSDKTGDKDILTYLKEYLQQKNPKIKEPYIGLIHRLDRPVGGIMMFAKTKEANTNLSEQIREKKLEKQYLAVVCGASKQKHMKLVDLIWKNERLNVSKIVCKGTNNAKEAILEYDVLGEIETKEFGILSLLRIQLHTGRHHQIRVQLANACLPLWGDTKYNQNFSKVKNWTQIALWAEVIAFIHPKTNKLCTLSLQPKEHYPFTEF